MEKLKTLTAVCVESLRKLGAWSVVEAKKGAGGRARRKVDGKTITGHCGVDTSLVCVAAAVLPSSGFSPRILHQAKRKINIIEESRSWKVQTRRRKLAQRAAREERKSARLNQFENFSAISHTRSEWKMIRSELWWNFNSEKKNGRKTVEKYLKQSAKPLRNVVIANDATFSVSVNDERAASSPASRT